MWCLLSGLAVPKRGKGSVTHSATDFEQCLHAYELPASGRQRCHRERGHDGEHQSIVASDVMWFWQTPRVEMLPRAAALGERSTSPAEEQS